MSLQHPRFANVDNVVIKTFKHANEFLGVATVKDVAYATRIKRVGSGQIDVEHHHHPIVRYYDDGSIFLCDHGYPSRSTKDRMERFTGLRIEGSCENQSFTRAMAGDRWRPWVLHRPDGTVMQFCEGNADNGRRQQWIAYVPRDSGQGQDSGWVDMMLSGDDDDLELG